jgi:hypothetical protein
MSNVWGTAWGTAWGGSWGAVPGPTVFYQAGGAGHPVGRKKRKRYETQELFNKIERSLEEALGLGAPVVPETESGAAAANDAPSWQPERLEAGLAHLATLAAGSARLEARLDRLKQAIEDEARARQDDDEFWMLLS